MDCRSHLRLDGSTNISRLCSRYILNRMCTGYEMACIGLLSILTLSLLQVPKRFGKRQESIERFISDLHKMVSSLVHVCDELMFIST